MQARPGQGQARPGEGEGEDGEAAEGGAAWGGLAGDCACRIVCAEFANSKMDSK